MRRYRIALLTGQLAVGGAERQLYLWLSNLSRGLFDPVVITLNPDTCDYWEDPIGALGIPLLKEPHRRNWIARLWNIIRLLKPFSPDLIHGWNLFTGPYAGLAGRFLGARSLGSLRGSARTFSAPTLESRLTSHLVDGLIVNSEAAANVLYESSPRIRRRIHVVPNAVKPDSIDRDEARRMLRSRFGVSTDSVWVASVGRLISGKRLDELLVVLKAVLLQLNNVHLFLVGDGPKREQLQDRCRALELATAVTFTGLDPDARRWFSAFDIFCFTSIDEGMPNAVMEAAAASVPVVAWRTPFMEELLMHDVSSLLVTPGNLGEFERSLILLAQDQELRQKLGVAAKSSITTRFNVDRLVREMSGAYFDVLRVTEDVKIPWR